VAYFLLNLREASDAERDKERWQNWDSMGRTQKYLKKSGKGPRGRRREEKDGPVGVPAKNRWGEGVGTGVIDLDGSRDMISKGFVLTWGDGSIVRESRREGGNGKEGGEGGGGGGGGNLTLSIVSKDSHTRRMNSSHSDELRRGLKEPRQGGRGSEFGCAT